MKILYTNFHKFGGGGHVAYIINLAKGLSSEHEVSIASPATSDLLKKAKDLPGVNTYAQDFTSRLSKIFSGVASLRKLIKREQFDVVHVNGSADHRHVMLACLGLKKRPKIIFTKHNTKKEKSKSKRLRAKFATNHVIAVSQYVKKQVLENSSYFDVPTSVVSHGIDTEVFSPRTEELKKNYRKKFLGYEAADKIVLGSLAGTDYDKGWLDLLEAISLLPEELRGTFNVLIAGDTNESRIQEQLERLGEIQNQLVWLPKLDKPQNLLQASDIGFVLSYYEALSFACREAMAVGLPVLVTNIGGLPENLPKEPQCGWIVPAHSPKDIADFLMGIPQQVELIREYGENSKNWAVQEFSLDKMVKNTEIVYRGA